MVKIREELRSSFAFFCLLLLGKKSVASHHPIIL
jgi:hypothetical protein